MDFAEIALVALQLLSPVLLAGLTWLAARVAALIQARVKNEYLRGVLRRSPKRSHAGRAVSCSP